MGGKDRVLVGGDFHSDIGRGAGSLRSRGDAGHGQAREEGRERADEVQELYTVMREIQKFPRADPEEGGSWAATISVDDGFWDAYPGFGGDFRAGGLLGKEEAWVKVFREEGIHLPAQLRRWLREGYWVWLDLAKIRGRQPRELKLSQEELKWAEDHVDNVLLPVGAIERVRLQDLRPDTIVCNVVVAYKNGEMNRFCWSGKPVNKGLRGKRFKMEAWAEIAAMVQPGDWAFSLDLEKGYWQFALADKMKDFCVFRVGDQVYRYKVMPFGLASAPRDFSFAVKRVVALFRARGIRVSFYIDDLIFFVKSRGEAVLVRDVVLGLLHRLGIRVSRKKSLLQPGQLLAHLGLEMDLRSCRLYVPESKVMSFKAIAGELVRHHKCVEGRDVARVVGKLVACRPACPGAVVLARGLMRAVSQLPLRKGNRKGIEEVASGAFQWRDFSGKVELGELAVAELRLWLQCFFKLRSARFGKRIEVVSLIGSLAGRTGPKVGYLTGEGRERCFKMQEIVQGTWDRVGEKGRALRILGDMVGLCGTRGEEWRDKRLHICTDVVGAAKAAAKGSVADPQLHTWSLRLWGVALKYGMEISCQVLAADGIYFPAGEGCAEGNNRTDCVLAPEVFSAVWVWKGPFEVDCCASKGAVQRHPHTGRELPSVSPFLREAVHTDVLSFIHPGRLYAFPPGALVFRLLAHILREGLRMVVVLPWWPTQPWFPWVLRRQKLSLGMLSDVVRRGPAGVRHPFGQQFDTAAAEVPMVAVAFNL